MQSVRIYDRFEDLPKSYEKIFEHASSVAGVFVSLPWFRNLVSTAFEKNRRMRIYAIESDYDGDDPYLVLPMCYSAGSGGILRTHRLTAATNFYTSLFSPAVHSRQQCTQTLLNTVVHAIVQDPRRWHAVDLHPMEMASPLFNEIVDAFRQAGMPVQKYFCFGNWYLEVKGRTYEEYFNSLPSKLKNTVKRKIRQLECSNRLRVEIISNEHGLAQGIAAYEQVYHSSWKLPETYQKFMPGFIHTCAEQGWLRMGVAYIDNQPAAAQVWVVSNGIASIYKLAYDERFSRFSVGSILTAKLMQQVIDIDEVREVDYLTGDDEYKQQWMSHRRERWGIVAFNMRTIRGSFLAARHIGGQALKEIFRAFSLKQNQKIPFPQFDSK